MKNALKLLVAIGVSLMFLSPAFGEESSNYSRSGFYLGVGGLYAMENFDTGRGVDVDNGPGFNFRLGYRFHPNIAVEAMGERVDDFDLENAIGLNVDTWTGTVNGKAFLLTDRFQPYGLLGIGFMRAHSKIRSGFNVDNDDTDLAYRFGGGLDSYITENWVVN